jgi:hypothetical protein
LSLILFILFAQHPTAHMDARRLVEDDVLVRPEALERLAAEQVRQLIPVMLDEAVAKAEAEGEPIARLATHEHFRLDSRADILPSVEALTHVRIDQSSVDGIRRGIVVRVVDRVRRPLGPNVLIAVRRGCVARVHHDDGVILAEAGGLERRKERKVP